MDNETQSRWDGVKETLKRVEEDGSGTWWDHEEIRDALHEAALKGIDTKLVLACREACDSRHEFLHHVQAMEKHTHRILAIDDEQSFLDILSVNLADLRYEVRTEIDPSRALQTAREFRPDLILLDVVMPGADGLQLLDDIRQDEILKDTGVIMFTALAEDIEAGGVTEHGTLFLSKPLCMTRLAHCITEHLRRGRR
ncbi:MAG: CheY-like chemotaxis protein [Verrucomicrobiales bacterium]|jgi:CheY-like chemotaxis protein